MATKALEQDGQVRTRPRRPSVASRPVPIASVMKGAIAVITKMNLGDLFDTRAEAPESGGVGRGILEELSKTRTTLLALQDIRWWRRECPHGLRDVSIKGVIVTALLSKPLLKEYASMGVPLVVVDQPSRIPGAHSVTTANREAAADATRRLLSRGHRRLAFVRAIVPSLRDVDPDAKERQDGFIQACEEAQLPETDFAIFSASHDDRGTLSKLIRSRPRYTGIITSSEGHARQLVELTQTAGLKMPRDISLATFHNRNHNSHNWSGPGIDFEEMGRLAVRILIDAPNAAQHARVQTKWNAGATMG